MDENSIYALKGTSALYEVLGVPQTATQREIRQAFYRLAVVYHPDKNPEGGEVFKEVSFAHGILSDPEQRAMYDSGTLRSDIEGKARAYDPSMDPSVELSPEDLRAFVDRVRRSHDANRKEQSSFEQRREEEMKRRAEFDARNPAFRADYERARRLRQRGMGGDWGSSAQAIAIAAKPRTSAEVLADLQRKEEERLRGHSASSSGLTAASDTRDGGLAYKQQMMARYRAAHSEYAEGASRVLERAAAPQRSQDTKTNLPFVQPNSDGPQYSEALDGTLRTLTNFDYRTFVEENSVDRGKVDGAILADALSHYDRNN